MKTQQVIGILQVVSWILFIGLCIQTGAMVISLAISTFINHDGSANFYQGMDLSELMAYSQWHYFAHGSLLVWLSGLKAFLFFQVVKAIGKINITHPFSKDMAQLISKMSGIALQIGITALLTQLYAGWLVEEHVHFTVHAEGSEFLYLAGILFVIAMIFKRGIEIQSENELTI